MTVEWIIRVRFRAFGITFGTLDKTGFLPIPSPPPPLPIDKVLVNERGVYLQVKVN